MKYNPDIHHRRSIRLRGYDYSQPGSYFVTICTQDHECFLGDLVNEDIKFMVRGVIAYQFWLQIPNHFPNVELDEFVVMPNHIHGIIVITDKFRGREQEGELKKPNLGQIIAYYKYQTTKIINQIDDTPGIRLWQRNYYERIIRNQNALYIAQQYILANPLRWPKDPHNPRRGGVSPPS
ncbi:transposase [Anabaena cylindrica UHCC 0172]|uniref:transposase n=1 Tax=Anabaena cylindrica TaxID=1165 RepID=UPI002B220F3B|nr:transposase [Anabaena cylindrica]MEA5551501.1 transposase [Anabaena cylindrica UHCC 0172]